MDDKKRLFKQIIIAAIYLAVFSGVGTGIYFLVRPTPAPLTPPAPTIYPLKVIWSQAFVSGSNLYSVGAKITNPNTGFGSSSFGYAFFLYDSGGILLGIRAGESFIWPGESKYLIEGGINDLTKAPVKVELKIGEPIWHEVKDFKGIDLTVGNVSHGKGISGSGKFYIIEVMANNNTSYNLDKVYISAVIFDSNGLPIAINPTILDNLKSMEQRPFSIVWFTSFLGAPARVELNISTNLWERPELLGQ